MLLPAEESADTYWRRQRQSAECLFAQWIRSLGYALDWISVDPDVVMIATIYVAQGVMDQLVDFFEQTIEQPQIGMEMN